MFGAVVIGTRFQPSRKRMYKMENQFMDINQNRKNIEVSSTKKPSIAVVIPTFNEILYLPNLLNALENQTQPPNEIIVADAGSVDGTLELLVSRGMKVVRGGKPAVGRNAGARAAKSDLLLFLDADVLPSQNFLANLVNEFEQNNLDVATCYIEPLEKNYFYKILSIGTNFYIRAIQPLSPHAPGFCILSKRTLHKRIGGFNELLLMSEDIDYVRRAKRYGRFGILSKTTIPVSMRRVKKEGIIRLGLKYAWCEIHALVSKPIYHLPFEYEFGVFGISKDNISRISSKNTTPFSLGYQKTLLKKFPFNNYFQIIKGVFANFRD